ncbi:DUF6067 family protein [Chitinophagaceae bacterium 26-R-25]|nr:DUF6067 family protein [Chitinophagaceae bacterium 26-R-25]
MKKILCCCLFVLVVNAVRSQELNLFQRQWKDLEQPTNVSFANSNIRYRKDRVPNIIVRKNEKLFAWKGEKINTEILIWTSQARANVSLSATDLKDGSGDVIDKKNISLSFVKYVWTDGYFGNGCAKRNNQQLDSSLVADLIDTVSSVSLMPNSVQPVWLSIQVPGSSRAGTYSGKIVVRIDKKISTLDIQVKVSNSRLPDSGKWSFDLDLWQYPVCIAKFHKVELWSDEHFKIMRPYFLMLGSAGQKCITISMIEGGNQDKDVSPAMIKFIKKTDGSWKYDYTLFDKYVSFVMSCGINKRINCYSMIPWTMNFRYHDEASNADTSFNTSVSSVEYKNYWQSFLTDFAAHLKQKKWFEKTSIAMDERKLEDMLTAIKIVKETDADWHVSLAGSYHPELADKIYDYSIFKASLFSKEELSYRNQHRLPSTFYTSCEGERPNMFTFSSPAESVWMGWYASAKGFTGYLRWGFNLWNDNPLNDSRWIYPGGDAFQIYPGPRSSVRFEKLIEGIQSFEKIKILKELYHKSNNKKGLSAVNNVLNAFDNERLEETSAEIIIQRAGKIFLLP